MSKVKVRYNYKWIEMHLKQQKEILKKEEIKINPDKVRIEKARQEIAKYEPKRLRALLGEEDDLD